MSLTMERILRLTEHAVYASGPRTILGQKAGIVVGQAFHQTIKGDYAEDTTVLGTVAQIGVSFVPGLDTAADIRDLSYDASQLWNNFSWGNAGWVALDIVGFFPVVGALKPVFKHGDDVVDAAGTVIKNADNIVDVGSSAIRKADDVIDAAADVGKHVDNVTDIAKQGDSLTDTAEAIIKHGDNVDALSGS